MGTRTLNPAFVEAIKQGLNNAPYFRLLGMKMLTMEPGRTEFIIPAREEHLNPQLGVHGGAVASLVDPAGLWAAYAAMDSEMAVTTIDLKVSMLAPGRAGCDLRAEGRAVKAGRTLGVGEARVIEEPGGRLVAYGSVTCMALDRPFGGAFAGLPRKFLE